MEEKKEIPKFAIYRSETSNKFFVKYEESPEREISETEYNDLKEQKSRFVDAVLSDPVIFKKKDSRDIKYFGLLSLEKTDAGYKFEHGTCYGNLYLTEDCIVIDTIFNSEKGNGDFGKTINQICNYSRDQKKSGVTICNLNEKLIRSLVKKIYPAPVLVTSNILLIKTKIR